jgi:hypothetical protein
MRERWERRSRKHVMRERQMDRWRETLITRKTGRQDTLRYREIEKEKDR